jgi:hypothetical protein
MILGKLPVVPFTDFGDSTQINPMACTRNSTARKALEMAIFMGSGLVAQYNKKY